MRCLWMPMVAAAVNQAGAAAAVRREQTNSQMAHRVPAHTAHTSSQCRLVTARTGCMALLQTCALAAHKPAGCAPLIWVGSKLQQQLHSCLAKGPACGEGRHRHCHMQGRGALARLLCGGSLLQQRMGRLQLACRWHTARGMGGNQQQAGCVCNPQPAPSKRAVQAAARLQNSDCPGGVPAE